MHMNRPGAKKIRCRSLWSLLLCKGIKFDCAGGSHHVAWGWAWQPGALILGIYLDHRLPEMACSLRDGSLIQAVLGGFACCWRNRSQLAEGIQVVKASTRGTCWVRKGEDETKSCAQN